MTTNVTRSPFDQAYTALQHAAARVGAHQWACQHAKGQKRYTPTWGHRCLVDGMDDLSRGRITPAEAMALLHFGQGAEELSMARKAGR